MRGGEGELAIFACHSDRPLSLTPAHSSSPTLSVSFSIMSGVITMKLCLLTHEDFERSYTLLVFLKYHTLCHIWTPLRAADRNCVLVPLQQ